MSFLRLPGAAVTTSEAPKSCHNCGKQELYQQPDFRKSVGLTIITVASLATCVLFYKDMNWWLVWSPMLVALVFDRLFARTAPQAVICYLCDFIHRGMPKESLAAIPYFDLEHYDRLHYAERTGQAEVQ